MDSALLNFKKSYDIILLLVPIVLFCLCSFTFISNNIRVMYDLVTSLLYLHCSLTCCESAVAVTISLLNKEKERIGFLFCDWCSEVCIIQCICKAIWMSSLWVLHDLRKKGRVNIKKKYACGINLWNNKCVFSCVSLNVCSCICNKSAAKPFGHE